MATIRINNTAFAAGTRFAPVAAPRPAAPTKERKYATGLRPGTIVEFCRARQPQVVHQAVVFFDSDGQDSAGNSCNRSFASLNDDLNTIWRTGVDTVPGTYRVVGTMAAVEVNPA